MTPHLLRSIAGFFVIMLVVIWVLSPPDAMPARFGHAECRRVTVNDPVTGAPIVGAEDIALWRNGANLMFTAYDRRDSDKPNGGLYSVSVWDLDEAREVTAKRMYPAPDFSFRPHGFAISSDGRELSLINRPKDGSVELLTGPLSKRSWRINRRLQTPRLCRANDLDYPPGGSRRVRITLDRGSCTTSVMDLLPWARTGRVISTNGVAFRPEMRNLSFANGIVGPYVAETRSRRIAVRGKQPIDVPGGPDNLTQSTTGNIIAALHPKTFLTWLGLIGYYNRIPSRIVQVDPDTKRVDVLFDDPSGSVFSGATTAILTGQQLIAGSAIDHGLLVCGRGF